MQMQLVHTIDGTEKGGMTVSVEIPSEVKCCCGKNHIKKNEYINFSDLMGRVTPKDIGKRVYWTGKIFQVENDEQLARRK